MDKGNWTDWNSKKDNFKKYHHVKTPLVYGKKPIDTGSISVVIITHKRAHGLKAALDSALSQDYKNFYSISVLDDSGFDQATDDLMKEYCKKHSNISYYRNDINLGQYANWNRACEISPTEWFSLLHDDDTMKPNFLSEVTKALDGSDSSNLGLLGVYFDTVDLRTTKPKAASKRLINQLTKVFINLRAGRLIPITLSDNSKLIYTLSCCLTINRDKVKDIGGLDDAYFPSADFVLTSKMNYYYSTVFLPKFLCDRGIAENESLKRSVCEDSIRCAYHHTEAILKTTSPSMSDKKIRQRASFSAVAAEIGVLGYDDSSYSTVKTALGMKKVYNSNIMRLLIMIKSRILWGALLFRNAGKA